MKRSADQAADAGIPEVDFRTAVAVWWRIGLLSFGGPAGQIALMHRVIVEERRWLDEQRFLHALNYCMLLPGPEAQQLATYVGWLLHGVRGGLVAGSLFILPGALAMLALSWLYVLLGNSPLMDGLFFGLKAAVLAIVAQALIRIAARALHGLRGRLLAGAGFLALYAFGVPFPLVVLGAGLVGWAWRPHPAAPFPADAAASAARSTRPGTVRAAAICAVLWAGTLLGMLTLPRADRSSPTSQRSSRNWRS
jgi:chromate transporter